MLSKASRLTFSLSLLLLLTAVASVLAEIELGYHYDCNSSQVEPGFVHE